MKNILVIGATSAIAEQTIRLYAKQNTNLYLLGRDEEKLQAIAQDAQIRGAESASFHVLDFNNFDRHPKVLEAAFAKLGTIDLVLIAHGSLPNQQACEESVETTLRELNTNAISGIALLTLIANQMEMQGCGTIAVITSVAGDRGRQSNYVYGAAKGMLSIFLQGLRNRLFKKGVHVLDIKPGFVDTPMTAEFKKGPLWAKPETIAKQIVKAVERRKNTLYTPWFWSIIMLIIRNIPEVVFKKLKL
ncbi:SDR family oxidoreductase [Thiomicrorhabdus sp. ZW0627]|uniref:SDR family oxidoreductase n=1 Tax=Thiomicrorhabdus sp. ZW0627 TaxID=3039774 RepID=UPI0024370544|nr:SDR family oxidoreductase [Thiomicrorhabdus sp. ZW0627]MDG6773950.1 SDR family oxidoreductase [Thiomicrorhabdus sp. ZW0627]